MVELIIDKIISFITIIISIVLGIIFIVIPTQLYSPNEYKAEIEKDLCFKLGENPNVISRYEDWLGFELHQEVRYRLEKDHLEEIINLIKNKENCSIWKESESGFELEQLNTKYYYTADLNIEDMELFYTYSSY